MPSARRRWLTGNTFPITECLLKAAAAAGGGSAIITNGIRLKASLLRSAQDLLGISLGHHQIYDDDIADAARGE